MEALTKLARFWLKACVSESERKQEPREPPAPLERVCREDGSPNEKPDVEGREVAILVEGRKVREGEGVGRRARRLAAAAKGNVMAGMDARILQ